MANCSVVTLAALAAGGSYLHLSKLVSVSLRQSIDRKLTTLFWNERNGKGFSGSSVASTQLESSRVAANDGGAVLGGSEGLLSRPDWLSRRV